MNTSEVLYNTVTIRVMDIQEGAVSVLVTGTEHGDTTLLLNVDDTITLPFKVKMHAYNALEIS